MNALVLTFLRSAWPYIVMAGLFLWGEYWHHEAKDIKKDFAVYQAQAEANAANQKALELEKEKSRAKTIADAAADRDAALDRMRVAQAQAAKQRGAFLPAAPSTGQKDDRVCFDRTALESAIRKFDQDVQGIVGQGDTAIINGQTLLKSWPK